MMKTALAIGGHLAMSCYNIADQYFVGKLGGAEPLAAMGFTFPIVMLVSCISMALARASSQRWRTLRRQDMARA